MQVAEHIFKSYDIRGRYPDEVNTDVAYAVGNQLVGMLGGARFLVVHDARISGPELTEALAAGIEDAGAVAIVAGLGPTDLFYYGCATHNCAGVMITASHNPPDQNGFKIVRKMPHALSLDQGLSELRRRIKEEPPQTREGGRQETIDLEDGFVELISGLVGTFEMPRVAVIDTGNGASGLVALKLRDRLNLSADVIFYAPDGRFPNRGPDPMKPENHRFLSDRVQSDLAALGVALDGDGDRAIIIGPDGVMIPGDFVAALLSRNALKRMPGAPVLYDVRCSRVVRDMILEYGGKPVVNRVGHVYMKSRLAEEHAAFAGELSGHYYFPEFFGADSGILAALYMIRLASEMGAEWKKTLDALHAKYHVSGEINFKVTDAAARLVQLRQQYSGARISEIDGVTFDFGDWWFNVRSSNTEPLLRLNLEAPTEQQLKQRVEEVSHILEG